MSNRDPYSDLLAFSDADRRAARDSALSPAGETANTESWSGLAVAGARAAHVAADDTEKAADEAE